MMFWDGKKLVVAPAYAKNPLDGTAATTSAAETTGAGLSKGGGTLFQDP